MLLRDSQLAIECDSHENFFRYPAFEMHNTTKHTGNIVLHFTAIVDPLVRPHMDKKGLVNESADLVDELLTNYARKDSTCHGCAAFNCDPTEDTKIELTHNHRDSTERIVVRNLHMSCNSPCASAMAECGKQYEVDGLIRDGKGLESEIDYENYLKYRLTILSDEVEDELNPSSLISYTSLTAIRPAVMHSAVSHEAVQNVAYDRFIQKVKDGSFYRDYSQENERRKNKIEKQKKPYVPKTHTDNVW